jgi:hypothetical protein
MSGWLRGGTRSQAGGTVRCTFMYVAYERVQLVESIAAVFPLTGEESEDVEWKCQLHPAV